MMASSNDIVLIMETDDDNCSVEDPVDDQEDLPLRESQNSDLINNPFDEDFVDSKLVDTLRLSNLAKLSASETLLCAESKDYPPGNLKKEDKTVVGSTGKSQGKNWKKNASNNAPNANKNTFNYKKKNPCNENKNAYNKKTTPPVSVSKINTTPTPNLNTSHFSIGNSTNICNKKSNEKIAGFKIDILKTLNTLFINELKGEKCFTFLDNFVLYLHYRVACLLFIFLFIIVANRWYQTNSIVCINAANADVAPKPYLVNICLSYSAHQVDEGLRYVLFYRWVPYSVVLISAAFYLPRLVMKRWGGRRVRKFMEDLCLQTVCYDNSDYEAVRTKVLDYLEENLGHHGGIYPCLVLCHLLALVIAVMSCCFLDFVLQGNFYKLPWSLSSARDTISFRDPLSLIFPPFVTCIIGPPTYMLSAREDTLYCHLTLMELYEKVFLVMWVFLLALVILGILSFLVLATLPLPCARNFLLRTAESSKALSQSKKLLLSKLHFADIFILYLIKCQMADSDFALVLLQLPQMAGSLRENVLPTPKTDHEVEHGQYTRNIIQWGTDLPSIPSYMPIPVTQTPDSGVSTKSHSVLGAKKRKCSKKDDIRKKLVFS